MGKVIKFRRRSKRKARLPEQWQPFLQKNKTPKIWQGALAAAFLGILIGVWSLNKGDLGQPMSSAFSMSLAEDDTSRKFAFCHTGGGLNCVVDGDTIWLDGTKIRIADIDAPETHPPRCALEAELGAKATKRLHELLNAGPFTVKSAGSNNSDQFGRKLRTIWQDGRSIGTILVEEGLARRWDGSRHPWC